MNQRTVSPALKRLIYFWLMSFSLAIVVYYLLWFIMPRNHVFGSLYRMPLYHWVHPISYITLVCTVYALIASSFSSSFYNGKRNKRITLLLFIVLLTVLVSSPLGGMLWHLYDMQAGYFPEKWLSKIIFTGSIEGLQIGWLIILLSIPYNIIGCFACFFITKKGSSLFRE